MMGEERENRGERIVDLMISIDELTKEEQDAICLAIKRIKVIRELCRNPGATHKELEGFLEEYKQRNDYMGQILAGLALHYMDTGAQE